MRTALVLLTFLFIGIPAQASEDVETVLVTGEQPGPSLWEITDGEHSLWVLASYGPLPAGMSWRSREVEEIIADSQEILGAYQVSFTVDDASSLRTKRSRLKRVLTRKQYAQWTELKKKYIGNVDTETLLPATAALVLRTSALEHSGLAYTDDLWRAIYILANRHGVPINTAHQVTIPIHESSMASTKVGVEYLVTTMNRLEQDLREARHRANAWAVGDIAALREYAKSEGNYAFLNAESWPFLQGRELEAALALGDERWIESAHRALRRNRSTFAVLPAYLIFREDGPLAALEKRGYVLLAPDVTSDE